VLIAAALLADMLWPVLVILGMEQVRIAPGITTVVPLDFISYPYSHSLVLLVAWGLAMGWLFGRSDRRAMLVIAALVVSHWSLDFVTHRPDMPLYPGGPKFGLELWRSVWLTAIVEIPLFVVGAWLYMTTTRPTRAVGRWSLLLMLTTLLLIFVGDLASPEPPPSVEAITAVAIGGSVLFIAWSGWTDRYRSRINTP
jgi:uncharacterized membrane protein